MLGILDSKKFSTRIEKSRLDEKNSRLVVRIRLEEIILDSAKIFSTRGKNSRLDDKILDSMKKFSTRKKRFSTRGKNSRLQEKNLDSKKKISTR